MSELALKEIAMARTLRSRRTEWDAKWQKILEWCTPHNAYLNEKGSPGAPPPTAANRGRIHDTTAISSCNTLADGHMSSIVPRSSAWFRWDAPEKYQDNDTIKDWYQQCSASALSHFSLSNFYPVIYSVFRDRSGPGTGGMFVEKGENRIITFQYMKLGSYSISENRDGDIDTIYRDLRMTAIEAVDKFGKDKVGKRILDSYNLAISGDANETVKKWDIIHGVRPNLKRDKEKFDAVNMPYHSRYIAVEDQHMIEDGGMEEFSFIISRYEKWGDEPYGFSPAYNAMPNILTANYLVRLLKAIGELKMMPRTVSLAGEKKQIDMRAGGHSTVSDKSAAAGMPREWATASDFELGQWLLESERKEIRNFFHTELFRMFSGLNEQALKDMTAEVARGLKSEGLLLLAPSFTQFSTDMQPGMEASFAILYRAGVFPPIPQELAADLDTGSGFIEIPAPKTSYLSKVGMALQEMEDESADLVMGAAGQAAALYPDILDNLDLDEWIRNKARIKGVPAKLIREWDEVKKFREEKAAALQKQQAAMMAQQTADVAATASKADPQKLQQLAAVA